MLPELVSGLAILIGYFAVCTASALILRRLFKIPREVYRKTLHLIVLGSIFFWTAAFQNWWVSALAMVAFITALSPVLWFLERFQGYSVRLSERRPGEVRRSLIVAFTVFTILISVCWGVLGRPYLFIASLLAWGLGDAAAALVGQHFGQHFIEGRLVDGRKTLEGTIAMFVVSFLAVLAVLVTHSPLAWQGALPVAAATAAVCAIVELYTKGGMDTLTCPVAAALTLIPLLEAWGRVILWR